MEGYDTAFRATNSPESKAISPRQGLIAAAARDALLAWSPLVSAWRAVTGKPARRTA
jgi:hypothetical protein